MAQPAATASNHTDENTPPRSRASVACESCKRRKCKCRGGYPCTACVGSNITCVLDETLDRRRKAATKRALDDLETYKEVLDALLQVIRSGDEQDILQQVRQNATLFEISEGLKKKLESSEATNEVVAASSPISSTRQDMPSAFTDMVEPANQTRRRPSTQAEPEQATFGWPMSGKKRETAVDDGPSHVEQEHDRYRRLIALLQSGSEEEAVNILRILRSMADRGDLSSTVLLRAQPALESYSNQLHPPTLSSVDPANDPKAQHLLWNALQNTDSVTSAILPRPRTTSRPARLSESSGSAVELPRFGAHTNSATDIGQYITSTQRREKRSERKGDEG